MTHGHGLPMVLAIEDLAIAAEPRFSAGPPAPPGLCGLSGRCGAGSQVPRARPRSSPALLL